MDRDEDRRTSPSGIAYTPPAVSPAAPPAAQPPKRKWRFQWNWKLWLLIVFVVLPLLRWLSHYVE
ncbi:MAG: hypothetical protein ACR2JV_00010 [Gaiellales bacterium]